MEMTYREPVADWPSGAPGVFPVGRCTMWAGPLCKYKEWIIVNVGYVAYTCPSAQTNGQRSQPESNIQINFALWPFAVAQKRSSMSKCFSQSNRRRRDLLFTLHRS